jgi:hypothetical protein
MNHGGHGEGNWRRPLEGTSPVYLVARLPTEKRLNKYANFFFLPVLPVPPVVHFAFARVVNCQVWRHSMPFTMADRVTE